MFCSILGGMQSIHPVSRRILKARGSRQNPKNKFDRLETIGFDDGWDDAHIAPKILRTSVTEEVPRRVISYNRSPDLPFDRSINPYRGCEHGCSYCYARPSHGYLGLSAGIDFETRLIARPQAAMVLRQELANPKYVVKPIAIGTNTDPYQPVEKKYEITRSCLQVLADCQHPVAIITRGALVERDIDILAPMAARGLTRVGISITTLDRDLARKMEPRAPSPSRRLEMIRQLADAGIPVRVMASPLIPGLTDHELEAILAASKKAGACSASWIALRLPREVSDLIQDWLATHQPNKSARVLSHLRSMHGGALYRSDWGSRMRGEGPYAALIEQRFKSAIRRLGLREKVPKLTCDLFQAPVAASAQMELF